MVAKQNKTLEMLVVLSIVVNKLHVSSNLQHVIRALCCSLNLIFEVIDESLCLTLTRKKVSFVGFSRLENETFILLRVRFVKEHTFSA